VPPVAELYPGFDLVTWMGVFAPAGTPEAVRELLHGSLVQVLGRAELRERLAGLGTEVVAADGRELAALVSRELALYEKIVRSAGIQPQ
jgi:tripartite-type tricarboxylate transporter receptor subunit TctC